MAKDSERIESVIEQRRVKLHIFEPSQRKIWTVVGKGKEHWLDPYSEFCSCLGYYFGKLNYKQTCYHLESQKLAEKQNQFEKIIFSDDEFAYFITGIVSDL